ncbi:MAG: hypothetical protein ACHQ53_15310 [Polyangiales bacterium]
MRATLCASLALLFALPGLARADARSWLRTENGNVLEGNQKLAAGDGKSALAAYDRAARELPSEAGVHLDRGLALLKTGDLPAARQALELATRPPGSSAVRADAYYDLGVAFYKEADAKATEKNHEEAQKLFREASDAFKHGLRLRPRDRNGAWNFELATRRIHEQEEKQKQEQNKDDQKKNKDQNNDKNKDQNKDQKDQPQDQKQDQQKQDPQKQDQAKQDQQKQDQQKQNAEQKTRPEVEQALDALQSGEQNLERLKAMNRAAQEQRKPEKDW